MLSNTLVHVPRVEGLQILQRRGDRGARELTTGRVILTAGRSADYASPDEETVIVLLEGRGRFEAIGQTWPIERDGVFSAPPTGLYLPPGATLTVTADTPLEAVFVSTPAPGGGHAAMCAPSDVTVAQRGTDLYRREVRNVFVGDQHARRLMVGETVNAAGHWSSYPPHKHDATDGELRLEEMYYYRVQPADGFALHIAYTATEEATHTVRDGDLVLIPYGYHSVSAPPRYQVYYLWAIAGDERKLAVYEDPAHRWVHSAAL